MLEKLNESFDSIKDLVKDDETKQQLLLDGLEAIKFQLTDENANITDGGGIGGLGGGGIKNPK